ncbi:hypothetical protein K1T71_006107 [Dendrolimus kikuchii]|uniref:Uncharacterized protein n=1 Tax=Dendrolimus kikuchii TaxID=765133 RepID=A0ACC1D3I3_9NEOP|nr:hypothetical protein K1T71_006107 [Dendrolimus kikuchii]
MDVIETIKKDKAYVKCKLVVKNWEREFKLKNSRIPSKFDIKEAPPKIKYAYKKYFQLKSTALENSLSICDIENDLDDFQEPVTQTDNTLLETDSPNAKQILDSLPSGEELEQLLSHENKRQNHKNSHKFTENLSKKLFLNRKFSLRNPRKFSLPKSECVSEDSIINDNTQNSKLALNSENSTHPITFDDNIDRVNKKSVSVSAFLESSRNRRHSISKQENLRQLDMSWLKRAAAIPTDSLELNVMNNDAPRTFGIGNIKLPIKDKPLEYVENSESDGDDISIAKLKPALKKRKINNTIHPESQERHYKSSSDNETLHEISMKKNKKKVIVNIKNKNNAQTRNIKKLLTEQQQQPPDIKEYVPFSVEIDIHPRYGGVTNIITKNVSSKINNNSKKAESDEQKLEKKIKSGTLNDNFVKINIEKKVFVRGKKGVNYSKYKKQQWKDKKALHSAMEFPEAGKISCFKCGQHGHMARYCTSHKTDILIPLENITEDYLPSLEDVKNIATEQIFPLKDEPLKQLSSFYESSLVPDSFITLLAQNSNDNSNNIEPIYLNYKDSLHADIHEDLNKFGYESFRLGQEEAIKRILCGMSTLLILPTGGGKSLCYQLPAYIYSKYNKCIALIISPLVSLMEDQVLNVPDFLKAGCLHANQSQTQRSKIIECLKNNELNILLISPEALISGETSNGISGLFKALPPIAFACIDEAHCVSQWSHNFRPSYLMISRVLREKLKVKCILGLTATASQATIKSVIDHLNIPDGINGVITNPTLPDNLYLSASFEKDKDKSLVSFLTSERIKSFNSIIVYCIRRDECERVAAILRSCLQENGKMSMETKTKKRKRMSYIAEAYHAGMSASQRKKIQKHFMDGSLRIIVATVAFGMGINKSDIRCIIHYNMPSSFESYVQEVGRAGRDGKLAVCHVFMNNSNQDKNELLKHIHANSIDRIIIRKLLQKVFIPCECETYQNISCCKGHEVGIPIDTTVEELDLPSENIATLLCYVELHQNHYLKLLNNVYIMCKISSYGGPQKIFQAAKSCRPLAMAILLLSKIDPDVNNKSIIEFDVIEVASAIGCESGVVKYQLKNLEWHMDSGSSRRSHLKVEFNTLGFRIRTRGDLTPLELDTILDDLHKSVILQEKTRLYQLEECGKAFMKLSNDSTKRSEDDCEIILNAKSNELKATIRSYFNRDHTLTNNVTFEKRPLNVENIASDVRSLVSSYKDCSFTGRSIARIFQGISSPNFPAIVWGRTKYWRSHIHEDFNGLIKVATQQIMQMK